MKRKQGRVTERSRTVREEKKGKEENSFHRKGLCFLTCLLMGDPVILTLLLLPIRRTKVVINLFTVHSSKQITPRVRDGMPLARVRFLADDVISRFKSANSLTTAGYSLLPIATGEEAL